MCQPGRPRPQGESHDVSSSGLFAFQSAKSRGSSLSGFGLLLVLDLVEPLPGEAAVLLEARDAEVDVALDLVGVAALDQLVDEANDLVHRLGHLGPVVDVVEPEAARVLEVPLGRLPGALGARARRRLVDLVVHVGDVVDERHLVAALAQPALVPAAEHERPRVADVRAGVDGRAADVHPDRAGRLGQVDEPAQSVL